MSTRTIVLIGALCSCAPMPRTADAGAPSQFPRGVWNADVAQDGDEVAVYTLERNFETGLAEVARGTWSPSGGFSTRTVFGGYSAKFGGTVFAIPRGANIHGLSDYREPDERLTTRDGIQLFGGQEIGLTCDGLSGTKAAVYPDGSGTLAKTHADTCGKLHCRHTVFMSTTVDGGRSCPLADLSYDEVGDGAGGGLLVLHPSMRVAGMAHVAFFEWDVDGRRTRHVSDGGFLAGAGFWPTTSRVPTRVRSLFAPGPKTELSTGVPYYFSWEDAGIVRHDAPFAKYVHVVSQMIEVPSGVIVGGSVYDPPDPAVRYPLVFYRGLLVDKTGERVLGTFRRRRDGKELPPNVYVEGQYFWVSTSWDDGPDERKHARIDIEPFDFFPIEP